MTTATPAILMSIDPPSPARSLSSTKRSRFLALRRTLNWFGRRRSRNRAHCRYQQWIAVNELSKRDISELCQRLEERSARLPTISLITPVYNTDEKLLLELVNSVTAQIYEGWELRLVNDGSDAPHVRPLLDRLAKADSRIRVTHSARNGGISVATNSGVEMASGEIIAFVDHDDLLASDCTAELALYFADHPHAEMVYSDDDKIDRNGRRYAPQFKPDWSPTLLLSWMYLSHVFSVRKDVFQRVGGFRSQFDGCQDYDFALRASEVVRHVGHIPKILYHWRATRGSTATSGDAKPESFSRGLIAVREALERRGISGATAFHPEWAGRARIGMFDLLFPHEGPTVTIIIHANDRIDQLRRCLLALRETSYRNFEVLLVDSSREGATVAFLDSIDGTDNIRVVRIADDAETGNAAHLRNEAARYCSSDYLLFLDSDLEAIDKRWLSQMLGYAQLRDVAVVGARLYAADGTLEHAGLVHGGVAGLVKQAFRGLPPGDGGYLGLVRNSRECSAVKGSCMLTPRRLFQTLGGFDTASFAHTHSDVDYCLRVGKAGGTCIYCASAELRHQNPTPASFAHRSASDGANFRRRHGSWADPYYNPNLSSESERFEIEAVRPETRCKKPVRVVAVTHNLNREGAPSVLLDLLVGLFERDLIEPVVLAPTDGPLRFDYETAGIQVVVRQDLMQGARNAATQSAALAKVASIFSALGGEVVLANTLQTYWAIKAATVAGVPSIWAQHESEPWQSYFDYLPKSMRASAYEGFSEAYRVFYVAEATRRAWRRLESRGNFRVVQHGIPEDRLASATSRWTRDEARRELAVPPDANVLSVIGTVCRRKGQLDLVKAYLRLPPELRDRTVVFIAGSLAEPRYAEELKAAIADHSPSVVLTGFVDPFLYYAASDILVCTSRIESAPRTIVEGMACGLPIITTPVFGIPEIVRENFNAIFYEPGHIKSLAAAIEMLLGNEALRRKLAENSPKVLADQPGFEEMVEQYGRAIRQAVNLKVPR